MNIQCKLLAKIVGIVIMGILLLCRISYSDIQDEAIAENTIVQNGNKNPKADPSILLSNKYIQDLKLDFYLFLIGGLNRVNGSDVWTHYGEMPDTKFYVDLKLLNALTFHSLTKYISTPTPVTHTIDFTENYFTTKPLNAKYWVLFGKKWLDFSSFKSELYISPITKKLGHINQYTILAAADYDHMQLSGYIFAPKNTLNNHKYLGYGLDVKYHQSHFLVGASFINSLSDQILLQYNFGTGGFISQTSIHKKVPAASIYSNFNYNGWYVYDAIISALTPFSTDDLSYNHAGARPLALSVEFGKHFNFFKQSMIAVGRLEYTKDMLYTLVPKYQATVALVDTITPYIQVQVQTSYAKAYGHSDQAYQASTNKTIVGSGKGSLGILGSLTLRF
ncbi:LbtU family siderophore porin [Cysteiniphilum halobium]|uniref:LbtU family siderophore porin n=1 Tax=Cysteiniphilum halobium TaxID=2219059 RepID=UPI0013C2DE9B|nr:LbtU family siderophore porin [Cysteiniphilum halobium]